MFFSIIVPIYNTSIFLKDCLTSLFNQDFPKNEYEVILVDDASTENISKAVNNIIAEYKTKPNFTGIPHVQFLRHNYNKRQGGARNTGLNAAKGEYLFFLDSDDYWNAINTLSTFKEIINNNKYEIIRSISWKNISNNREMELNVISCDNHVVQMAGITHLQEHSFFYDIWTSCYSRHFLLQYNLRFREHVVFEDSDWSTKVFWFATCIGIINFSFYIHRLNSNSTAMKPRIQTFKDNILSLSAIDNFINSVSMPESCKKACYYRIKKSIFSYIRLSRNYTIATSLECIRTINRKLLKETQYYKLTTTEELIFSLILHCPIIIVAPIRILVLTKRFIRKWQSK